MIAKYLKFSSPMSSITWASSGGTDDNEFVEVDTDMSKLMAFDCKRFVLPTAQFSGREVMQMLFVVTDADDNNQKLFKANKSMTAEIIR